MAQRVQVILEDDRDGGPATQTIAFGLDGRDYEIDLSDTNAEALRSALAPWVTAARKTAGRRPARGPKTDTKAIREWALSQGIEVSARGRIPREIQDQYAQAQAGR